MTDTQQLDIATQWLVLADRLDYEATWNSSSELFQTAIDVADWTRSLKAARSPLGENLSRSIDHIEPMNNPAGAPDGEYIKLQFNSSFEKKQTAGETVTLVKENNGQWRLAGYFIQ